MGQEPEVICRFCGTCSGVNRVFCLGCGRRLSPNAPGTLTVEDFASDEDRSSLEALRGTEPLPHLVEKLVPSGRERSEAWLASYGFRIRPTSWLDTLVRGCGEVLGLDRLPKSYVAPSNQVNAFTAGRDDDPLLVIYSPVLDVVDYVGLEGLIAHELAHVKSQHILYHTLAESAASGVQFASSLFAAGLLTVPIRLALLSWYRESEVSSDRAALLVLGSYDRFASLMVGLTAADGGRAFAVEDGSLTELLQTHPSVAGRLRRAREYIDSDEYALGRAKILAAASSSRLVSACMHCGLLSPRAELFCPGCGLSRR